MKRFSAWIASFERNNSTTHRTGVFDETSCDPQEADHALIVP